MDWIGPLDSTVQYRRAVYTQAGTIGAAAIGLFVVPISLALALAPRERLRRVLSHKQGQLRVGVMQAATAAVTLIVFTVVAVAFDTTVTGNRAVRLVAPGVFAAAVLSLVRVLGTVRSLLLLSEAEARPSMAENMRPVQGPPRPGDDVSRSA